MVCPEYFTSELINRGVQHFSGIPCSYLTPLINVVIERNDTHYVVASSEGEALAIASGMWLGGKMSVVMSQNSGFGNMINPLTSLSAPFGIPILLLITWRGRPGEKDEPQHEVMGKIMIELLDLLGIKWAFFPKNNSEIPTSLDIAFEEMKNSHKPYAFILEKESFSNENGAKQNSTLAPTHRTFPSREDVLEVLLEHIPKQSPVIVTTGKSGRELHDLQDQENHFYCVGSMGYANAIAHGLALTAANKNVYVIDGDGAALMHLGNLTSIGAGCVGNLVHIILDNGSYDSTGGQPTVSPSIDFISIAKGAGYKKTRHCSSLDEFIDEIKAVAEEPNGPVLIHIQISNGSMQKLGRPSITPYEVARRLQNFMLND
ncbi:MAG: phosphonopyruvate decarboxylase [Tatlockia sp.]|nr:phosphonopyruvate decarboxylase [Tatlockia sp.]